MDMSILHTWQLDRKNNIMKRIEYKEGDIVGINIFIRDAPSRRTSGGQVKRRAVFLCSECGNEFTTNVARVKKSHTYMCGCKPRSTTHQMSSSKYHKRWIAIKQRCFNARSPAYKYYGARGITLFDGWINNFKSFYNYISQLHGFDDPELSIDRIDNDGNYEPGNIRWATRSVQNSNRRSKADMEKAYLNK